MEKRINTVVITCHDVVDGPPHNLRDFFLNNQVPHLYFIGHPIQIVKDNPIKSSYIHYFLNGKKIYVHKAKEIHLPELICYMKDVFFTLYLSLIKVRGKIDIFVGAGNLNAFTGIILKKFNKVDKVIYYVIDYIPVRYKNPFVNFIYHYVEKLAAKYSTYTWNYSEKMISMRETKWNTKFKNQLVTPHGIFFKKENFLSIEKIRKFEIVYLGFIYKEQGLQLILEAMKKLVQEFSSISFKIIGKGNGYEKELEQYVQENQLNSNVEFMGFIQDYRKVEETIRNSAVSVAMYSSEHPYIRNTDSGKIKSYLSCGLPVIMTNVGPISKEVAENKAGFVIDFDPVQFYNCVKKLFLNLDMLAEYRENAFKLAQRYDWNIIFNNALKVN